MKPVVDRLEKQYKDKVEFRLINVDNDQSGSALMQQYGSNAVPTFVFLNADGSKSDMKLGEMEEGQLTAALNKLK